MLTQETPSNIGVSVGIDMNADLGGLKSALVALNDALSQTEAAVEDLTGEVIRLVREAGIDNLVKMARNGSVEALQLIGSIYGVLGHAAQRGVQEAGEMFSTIGRKMEEAGYSIERSCGCNRSEAA